MKIEQKWHIWIFKTFDNFKNMILKTKLDGMCKHKKKKGVPVLTVQGGAIVVGQLFQLIIQLLLVPVQEILLRKIHQICILYFLLYKC